MLPQLTNEFSKVIATVTYTRLFHWFTKKVMLKTNLFKWKPYFDITFFFVETMKVSTCIQDNRNPGILKMHWKFSMFFYMNLKRNYQNRAIYKKGKFIMYDWNYKN